MPLLGMGTYGMGGRMERDESNRDESVEILKQGISLGLSVIDTAEVYGQGLCEEIVGKAIKNVPREQIYLISKVWRDHMHFDDVLRAAKGSLHRLGTEYIDLYLVHWPNEEVPVSETMRAMEKLLDDGMVRAIGVSNFSVVQMEQAQQSLHHSKIAACEFEYNLSHHDADQDILPYCKAHEILPIAYRPFAKGELAKSHNDRVEVLAKKYAKTPAQILLNWLLSQGILAIPKASSPEHMEENVGALGWSLSPEDIDLLRIP